MEVIANNEHPTNCDIAEDIANCGDDNESAICIESVHKKAVSDNDEAVFISLDLEHGDHKECAVEIIANNEHPTNYDIAEDRANCGDDSESVISVESVSSIERVQTRQSVWSP